jgi:TonB family protein
MKPPRMVGTERPVALLSPSYETRQKWRDGTAIAAAIFVHLAAIVLAGIYYREPIESLFELPRGTVEAFFEPHALINDLLPPPEVEASSPPPHLTHESLFPEERTKPLPRQTRVSQPIAKARNGIPGSTTAPSANATVLSAPRPEYPEEARQRKITGDGVVVLTVDPVSGMVTHVTIRKTTGSALLDHSAINGFRRWRFKPGSASKVRLPVTFTLKGVSS